MREIKFRAWIIAENTMFDLNDAFTFWFHGNQGQIQYADQGFYVNNPSKEICDFYLMQYTGLKDKNGKEIYQGDIRREEVEYNNGDETYYYVCTWIKELCMFSWLPIEQYLEYSENDSQRFEIIFEDESPIPISYAYRDLYIVCGNIYQNPELLNY